MAANFTTSARLVGRAGLEPAELLGTRFTVWSATCYGIPTHVVPLVNTNGVGAARRTRTFNPPRGALAFQASRLPLSHCCKYFPPKLFSHYFIIGDRTENRTNRETRCGRFCGGESGRRTHRTLRSPPVFGTGWRSRSPSSPCGGVNRTRTCRPLLAARPISNRLPYQIGLITPLLITNSIADQTHSR